jgi:hypothetical protein
MQVEALLQRSASQGAEGAGGLPRLQDVAGWAAERARSWGEEANARELMGIVRAALGVAGGSAEVE